MLSDTSQPLIDFGNTIFIGTVEDNNDPQHLSRIKARLEFYPVDLTTENMPWMTPISAVFQGGGGVTGEIKIPRIGSLVAVKHLNSDPHIPVYIGEVKSSVIEEFNEDYPNSYGSKDSNGNLFRINLVQKIMTLIHNGVIKFTNDGDIEITETGNVTINITGNKNVTVTGDLTASISGTSNITCPTTNIKGNVNITGDVSITGNESVSGNTTVGGNTSITGTMHSANYDAHKHTSGAPGTPTSSPDQ